ncbi:histidine kinase [Vagococcus sp. PNs007]|uniref:Histidine kinase n=1 Tax=Vagococcus proximus TaxID=2991417 RepID=A0ABT5X2W7_9ENTE|nr:histidine kinase [Vagococcus proximus]MDF0480347.1 histidine kinase [Vagococcus proximus]
MTFQKKLKKEMFIYSVILIILSTIGLGIGLYYYDLTTSRKLLSRQETEISDVFSSLETDFNRLYDGNKELYKNYLSNKIEEAAIYYQFSVFQSHQAMKSDLILLTSNNDLAFTTSSKFLDDPRLSYYLSLVLTESKKPEDLRFKTFTDGERNRYLLLIKQLANKGFVVEMIDQRELENKLNRVGANYIIYDDFDNVLASSSTQFIESSLKKVKAHFLAEHFEYQGNQYSSHKLALSKGMNVVTFTEHEPLGLIVQRVFYYMAPLFGIMMLFAIYFVKRFSQNNSESVYKLKTEMEKVMNDSTHRIEIEGKDEFYDIADAINKMLVRLNNSYDQNIRLANENLIFERKKLEAQFNPHFLYNTLEVIRSSCFYDTALTNRLILLLNDILRYSIDETITTPSLRDDLTYIKKYLEIAAIRFDDFSYSVRCSPVCEEVMIPKLLILPLIENSLKYGFRDKSQLAVIIDIKALTDKKIQITYMDDGEIMSPEDIESLLSQLVNPNPNQNHHGLMNCKRRLELMYPGSTFTIYRADVQTVVEMIIETGGGESCIRF